LKRGAKTSTGFTALVIASDEGNAEVVGECLKYEGVVVNSKDDDGCAPLRSASEKDSMEVVSKVFQLERVDVNVRNDDGRVLVRSSHGITTVCRTTSPYAPVRCWHAL
jgi:hypothetical protein